MIEQQRISQLNEKEVQKENSYVLYWMQGAARLRFNHALLYANELSQQLNKPLVVYFGVTDDYPEASIRHYHFMIQGIQEVYQSFFQQNIRMVIAHTDVAKGAIRASCDAVAVVTDAAYVRHEREWREFVASSIAAPLIMVESNLVVPIREASFKEEYSAATLRRKIEPQISFWAKEVPPLEYEGEYYNGPFCLEDIYDKDIDILMNHLNIDKSIPIVKNKRGGETEARKTLDYFIEHHLDGYSTKRNDPLNTYYSELSPFLHYGQISPIEIYLEVNNTAIPDKLDFIEQLVVRRELAFNFVFYNPHYDSFDGLPSWAKETLLRHSGDAREYSYSFEELKEGQTHDVFWNAAQAQLRECGTMHNYMRMYWGKKILEWTSEPRKGYEIALSLNNLYQLDGRDPNGFTGVAWCFGKHDRPWGERPIFGLIRYMNDKGLMRKFDMKHYVEHIEKTCNITLQRERQGQLF
ncbi:MAG: hypothetical protein EOM67_01475 [Spirochaetia bacterium]|nr:hypothetical protein [Spirochaetia bacterium]